MLYINGLRGCHCLFAGLILKCALGSCQMPRKVQGKDLTKELPLQDGGVEQGMFLTVVFVVFSGFQQSSPICTCSVSSWTKKPVCSCVTY